MNKSTDSDNFVVDKSLVTLGLHRGLSETSVAKYYNSKVAPRSHGEDFHEKIGENMHKKHKEIHTPRGGFLKSGSS